MEKKMFALTYCNEGVDDSYPYACTIAVSEDIEKLRAEMNKCIEEDTRIDEEDEWNDDCNFSVYQRYNNKVVLQHNARTNLYVSYMITSVVYV
jgi:hypothetical protein